MTLALLCSTLCVRLSAQPYLDLASAYFYYSPGGGVDENKAPKTFNHLRTQLNIPVVFKKDSSSILFNPIYEQRYVNFNDSGNLKHLNGLICWISYTKKFNDDWSLMLAGIPRWNGEPAVQFKNGFQLGGALLLTRVINPVLKLKAGLYYNKEFFGNFFMPVIGIEWKINAKSNLFGNLPSSLVYENRINDKFSWGGVFRTFPNSYRIVPSAYAPQNDYYRISDIQLGIYSDIYLAKKIVFSMEGGYAVSRKIKTGGEAIGGKDTETIVSDKGNLYVRASLQYRLRLY